MNTDTAYCYVALGWLPVLKLDTQTQRGGVYLLLIVVASMAVRVSAALQSYRVKRSYSTSCFDGVLVIRVDKAIFSTFVHRATLLSYKTKSCWTDQLAFATYDGQE